MDTKQLKQCDRTDCKMYSPDEDTHCVALDDVDFGDRRCSFYKEKKEYYKLMPPLNPEEYADLKADIKNRGVQVPIEFDENGDVLDGYHRLKACEELGITDYPKIIRKGMTEVQKQTHVRKLNMARRHLNQEKRSKLVRAQIILTPERSDRQIAGDIGVSHPTVGAIRREMEKSGDVEKFTTSIDTLGREQPRHRKSASEWDKTESLKEMPFEAPEAAETIPATREAPEAPEEAAVQEAQQTPETPEEADTRQKRYSITLDDMPEFDGTYDVLVIDLPWPSRFYPADVDTLKVPIDYEEMSMNTIKNFKLPANEDCHVFLWVSNDYLPDAFDVLEAWGADYVYPYVWHKSVGFKEAYWPAMNGEWCLYARIGTPRLYNTNDETFMQVFTGSVGNVGEKPEEFYEMVRRVTKGRRLDMFSRRDIEGFDAWGCELLGKKQGTRW